MKLHKIVLFSLVIALCWYVHSGCASTRQALAGAAWPAAGAAAGAGLGMLAGPVGSIVGAGVGAAVAAVTNQNSELRGGSLQGEGARDRELERLRAQLDTTRGALGAKVSRLDEILRLAKWAAVIAAALWTWSHPKGRAAVAGVFRVAKGLVTRERAPKSA